MDFVAFAEQCLQLNESDLAEISGMLNSFLRPMQILITIEHHIMKHGKPLEKDFRDGMIIFNNVEFE